MQRNRSMLLAALLCGSAVMAPLHAQPLSTDSTIRDVLAQPAFQGFADRLLPWDDGREPPNLPLNRVAAQGYNAFVVKYRAGAGGQAATQDMARAVAFVRENAAALKVNPNGYSVWGASAGARMAAAIGSYGTQAFGEREPSKPVSVIMLYTGHSNINRAGEPATFAAVGANDGIAAPHVMRHRIEQLKAMGVPTEFHEYPRLGHGFALGSGTSAAGWEKDALAFWQTQMR